MFRLAYLPLILFAAYGCSGSSDVQPEAPEGNTFVLSDSALNSEDPATQAWVAYSLARSACQIRAGEDNPAAVTSFNCEVTSRRLMLDKWAELDAENGAVTNDYLDTLATVQQAEFLSEYVVRYFRQRDWELPTELHMHEFRVWSVENLYRHTPETRLTGSWEFAEH